VQAVLPGGPAADAGVQAGDTVRSVNGTALATVDELRAALAAITDGDQYSVAIARDGADQSLSVQRMSIVDAMHAGIDRALDGFRQHMPDLRPSATPRPAT
jgi:C-terminal processing protease CtpA/Prc